MTKHINHHSRWRIWGFILLQIGIVILAMAVGFFGHHLYLNIAGEFSLLREAQQVVVENAIIEIPDERTMEYGMIRGMLKTFNDPYTYFVEPASHEVQTNQLTGSYGGIGLRLEQDSQMNWRVYPLPDSPAQKAGIQNGDILLQVGDLQVNTNVDEVTIIASLRGRVGRVVSVTLLREGQSLTYTIERQTLTLPSVTYNLLVQDQHIGLLQVNRIAETTADEIQTGIEDLSNKGADVFILDLRNNGGGLVEEGIEVVRLFVREGEIIRRQFKDQEIEIFEIENPSTYPKLPIAVLINGNTASAAEIISGALKDHDRAPLIGQNTFGKTAIQYVFDLQDGSSVHVTSGRWWIPGVVFPLEPDIPVSEGTPDSEIYLIAKDALKEITNNP